MQADGFDLISAVLAIPGLGNKALRRLLPPGGGLSPALDVGALDLAIQAMAANNTRIKYAGKDTLLEGVAGASALRGRHADAGIECITWFSSTYPSSFMALADAPPILYIRGDVGLLKGQPAVAIIGTREPTDFVARSLYRMAGRCADRSIAVVSGLALGCDAAAHAGSVARGGNTIAVLPGGVGTVYPPQHQDLAESIVRAGGLLVSEYPEGTPVKEYTFVARDRLQAALAAGVICGQAGIEGGAMHACRHAVQMGKPIAVLAPMAGGDFTGNSALIEADQAVILSDQEGLERFLADIMQPYGQEK